MTVRKIPSAPGERLSARVGKLPAKALERWEGKMQAGVMNDRVIDIYGFIGEEWDWNGESYAMVGTTSQQMNEFLRRMGAGPVTVNINSPGGDMFEGLAIYNLLREHPGEVTVNVVGNAASAASIIAMAGDVIQMGAASFFMIHNTWIAYAGNRNDFIAMAEMMLPFDKAMAGIYAARTGISEDEVLALMDAETWIAGADAVAKGFADRLASKGDVNPQASVRKPTVPKASAEMDGMLALAFSALAVQAQSLNLI